MVRRLGAAALAALVLAPASSLAQPVPPVRLSVALGGGQANGSSAAVAVSADGRQVLFQSVANNLVAGDTNGFIDLFVRDRDTDRDGILDEPDAVATRRMTEGLSGEQSIGTHITSGWMTPDGRFVFFNTGSPLMAADTNGTGDGYVRDRDADADGIFDEPGAVTVGRVTTGAGNFQVDEGGSIAAVTPDGRYVLFFSSSTQLHPPPVPVPLGYRKDLQTGLTVAATTLPDGTPPAASITSAAISADGRYVAFASLAGGSPGVQPADPSWKLRDLTADTLVSIPLMPASGSYLPLIITGQSVVGFSPDSSRLLLVSSTTGILGSFVSVSGSWYEYDVAAGRIIQSAVGVPDPLYTFSASQPTGADPAIGFGFTLRADNTFCVAMEGYGRFFYDRRTDRIRPMVGGRVGLPASSADGRRLLYLGGECVLGSPQATYLWDAAYDTPLPMPADVQPGLMDAAGTMVIGLDSSSGELVAVDLLSRLDRDSDGLDDRWEIAMGLDYTSAVGANGAAGDPDGDGLTNAQEQAGRSHPRGAARQFLAEGADNAFFKTRLGLANPGLVDGTAVVRLDGDNGTARTLNVRVPAGGKRTVFVDEVAGHSPSFATVVDGDVPLVSERTMSWDATEYGAHAERASAAPATTWFLAEGSTGGFSLFYLLQNPGATAATATIRYLRPAPLAPIDRSYTLPPRSRTTLPVNTQAPGLEATDVSAAITATQPILVERAMYRSVANQPFAAGHASAGVTAPATNWFLAEGATGDFFDLFILLANPGVSTANVDIRYLLTNGTVLTKSYTVPAESRRTIWVDGEEFPGLGRALESASLSSAITVTNGVPIVVERSMWFPGPQVTPVFWTEAHNSPGATATATRWVLADGEAGGSRGTQTFVLIANTSATAGTVRITALPDMPATALTTPIVVTVTVPPNSRTTVPMHDVPGLAGTRFGAIVESTGTAPLAQLVVERAMYWNSGGVVWAAGTNLLATPVP